MLVSCIEITLTSIKHHSFQQLRNFFAVEMISRKRMFSMDCLVMTKSSGATDGTGDGGSTKTCKNSMYDDCRLGDFLILCFFSQNSNIFALKRKIVYPKNTTDDLMETTEEQMFFSREEMAMDQPAMSGPSSGRLEKY
jgi:hypothetical protein